MIFFQHSKSKEKFFPPQYVSETARDLLLQMFLDDPDDRISVQEALKHPYLMGIGIGSDLTGTSQKKPRKRKKGKKKKKSPSSTSNDNQQVPSTTIPRQYTTAICMIIIIIVIMLIIIWNVIV